MPKGIKKRKSQYWTLKKNSTLNESFIFDQTLLNKHRIKEIREFEAFLAQIMIPELKDCFKEFCD